MSREEEAFNRSKLKCSLNAYIVRISSQGAEIGVKRIKISRAVACLATEHHRPNYHVSLHYTIQIMI